MSCDDTCDFSISTDSTEGNLVSKLSVTHAQEFRNYYADSLWTEWIALTQDELYYIEITQ